MSKLFHIVKFLILQTAIVMSAAGVSYAGKMEASIQEAIYLFEMKGEYAEAISILEKVTNHGDSYDRESAYFYLGKIQELMGNKTYSNYYYKQSLEKTTDPSKAYWVAEREAATSIEPEYLLKETIAIKSPIQQIHGTSPAFLELQDGSIKKIEDNKLVSIPITIPESNVLILVNSRGYWYKPIENDSIYHQNFHGNRNLQGYALPNISDIFEYNENTIVISNNSLVLLDGKGIRHQVPEKYAGCQIADVFKPTGEFILNCPDNALHFISIENGTENRTIAQFDIIQKILIDKNQLFLVAANHVYNYRPKQNTNPIWKIPCSNVEHFFAFGKYIAILEASGKVSLIDQETGFKHASIMSDATSMHPLALGTLGLFTSEGAITALDTALKPLWNFHFAKPISTSPIFTNGNIFLYFGGKKLQAIAPHYYGKKPLSTERLTQSAAKMIENERWDDLDPILDSIFKQEPGNAEGWFFKAMSLEKKKGPEKDKQKAWSEAVRLSVSEPQVTPLILSHYSKAINAKFVEFLPISPKTQYPQFFGSKKNVYTIDPAANKIICLNAENGEMRWAKTIGKMDKTPVISHEDNTLAIASGFYLTIYDLSREIRSIQIQLPGKAFETQMTENAIYVSTWNGFLAKINKADNKFAWSRKFYSVPFLMTKHKNTLYICNLEGEFMTVDDISGTTHENSSKKIQETITHLTSTDSSLVASTSTNKLLIFDISNSNRQPSQIILEAPVSSLQTVKYNGESKLIIGLANQSILFYSEMGAPIWKFQGKNSIYTTPFVKDNIAWIDQGNEVVGISLKEGQIEHRFSTPGGAGPPFVTNNTLFNASPKRLLYGFSL
ncbi:MAG: hypothetical protein HUK20_06320 [Fibrobacter sp.]|nr:hypothetical protein [Fibrobacter sp.]